MFAACLGALAARGLCVDGRIAPPGHAGQVVYTEDGAAIGGYDPVAYFAGGMPTEGSSEFEHRWMDATWHFASAANRDVFAADPGKYAPQYGGYCAWAVSQGYTASTDPFAWRIVDGKLYLNYSRGIQRRWEHNIRRNIANGDKNWPGIRAELVE